MTAQMPGHKETSDYFSCLSTEYLMCCFYCTNNTENKDQNVQEPEAELQTLKMPHLKDSEIWPKRCN